MNAREALDLLCKLDGLDEDELSDVEYVAERITIHLESSGATVVPRYVDQLAAEVVELAKDGK